mgnify:CR=1 FL=1
MASFSNQRLNGNCEGSNRRDCLKLGLGGLVAGGFLGALQGQTFASPTVAKNRQADACILIWLDGGPTHYETIDPKPLAPVEIRGEFEPIQTQVPGIHFSKHMKQLAGMRGLMAKPQKSMKGGVGEIITVADQAGKWSMFGNWASERVGDISGPIIAISFFVPTMLLLMGDANMYQRIFSAKDGGSAKKAVFFWIIGVIMP